MSRSTQPSMKGVTRRSVGKGLGAGIVATLAPVNIVRSQEAGLKVGVLLPRSGVQAGIGQDCQRGVEIADLVVERYQDLRRELLGAETFDTGERYRIDQRIRRLNELGFDVAELTIVTDIDGRTVQLEPKVVDAGHHSRRLLRLTGLDVEENQARRLLNDLDAYRAAKDVQGESEEIVAHRWVDEAFEPVVRAVPKDMRGKLEPAEIFHEILVHRWYLSERAGHEVSIFDTAISMRRSMAVG